MDLTDERALENEIRFRDANEQIDTRRTELALEGKTPYLCECEDERCTQLVRLTTGEYREVRGSPNQFMIATGHRTRGTLCAERDGYTIVEKTGL